MNKILLLLVAFVLFSCSKEEELETTTNLSAGLALNSQEFKGVFTTVDGEKRGEITIKIPPKNSPSVQSISVLNGPHAILEMIDGNIYALEGEFEGGDSGEIVFFNQNISFKTNISNGLASIEINNINYFNEIGSVIALRHSERAPVNPVTGSYECGTCNNNPFLGQTKTFSFVINEATGTIATQVSLGASVFNGVGVQTGCVINGTNTTCDIDSGDGVSIIGFTANGNPVYWSGTHIFDNQPIGINDCSGINGTWEWQSNNYGLITGTFVSDASCYTTIYTENFQNFTGSGFAPTPAPGQLDSDIIIVNGLSDGGMSYGDTRTSGDFARGIDIDGGVSTGGVYAFTVAGNSSLGAQPIGSDFTPGSFDFRIENTTGNTLNGFEISYDLLVNNNEGRANSFNFLFSIDGVNFLQVPALNYTSPEAADANGFVSIPRSATFNASVASGAFIYLRFEGDDATGSGSRDEFAIDNIVLGAN